MLFCVFVFVRVILLWCPSIRHVYIVYNILSLNIFSIYIKTYITYCNGTSCKSEGICLQHVRDLFYKYSIRNLTLHSLLMCRHDRLRLKKNTKNSYFLISVGSLYTLCFLCSVCFCTGHFVMVPIILTCPHCLQHCFFEHLFHLYSIIRSKT